MRNLPTFKLDRPVEGYADEQLQAYCRKKNDKLEIAIMDTIGEDDWGGGVSEKDIATQLNANPTAAVDVAINSVGGLAYSGLAVFNSLAAHQGHVTTRVIGLAYSAASLIFLAGDRRVMHESSDLGIHRASGAAFGTAEQMLSVATFLEKLDSNIVNLYVAATGQSEQQIVEWLDASANNMGTMFSAREAVDAGFADEVIEMDRRPAAKLVEAAAANQEQVLPIAIQARRDMIRTLCGK